MRQSLPTLTNLICLLKEFGPYDETWQSIGVSPMLEAIVILTLNRQPWMSQTTAAEQVKKASLLFGLIAISIACILSGPDLQFTHDNLTTS